MIRRILGRRRCHRCAHTRADHRHHHDRTYCAHCNCPAYHRRIGGRHH